MERGTRELSGVMVMSVPKSGCRLHEYRDSSKTVQTVRLRSEHFVFVNYINFFKSIIATLFRTNEAMPWQHTTRNSSQLPTADVYFLLRVHCQSA